MNAPQPFHLRSPLFEVIDGQLAPGGRTITALAEEAGQTPFYVIERRAVMARIAQLREVLPAAVELHYAIKANPMPALVQFVARQVDGLDVASGRELRTALDAGMNRRDISFAGPGKTDAELRQAIAAEVLINVESPGELMRISAIAKQGGRTARCALRVNPDFELKSSGMRMSGGPKQFGIDAEKVPEVLANWPTHAQFEGFHIFSGSQNLKAASICEAQTKAVALAKALSAHVPSPIKTLNIGGGFGIPYFPGDVPLDVSVVGAHLTSLCDEIHQTFGKIQIVVELGRYIVGEAGLYVARVIDRKESRGEVFLVTDGGMHHHLAASGNFGQVIRKNYPVAVANKMQSASTETASVVGPLCTPLDLLADRMELAKAEVGDLIAVYQSGAYGATASPQGFLSHPHVIEMLV